MWRSNAVMYVTLPYNKILFSILYFFFTSQLEVDFGIVLISHLSAVRTVKQPARIAYNIASVSNYKDHSKINGKTGAMQHPCEYVHAG